MDEEYFGYPRPMNELELLGSAIDKLKSPVDTISDFAPLVGDIKSGGLAIDDFINGDYGSAALNAVGLLPFLPSLGGVVNATRKANKIDEIASDILKLDMAPDARLKRAEEQGFLPETLYHGSNQTFPAFSNNMLGSQTDADWSGWGHWFTVDPEEAGKYANATRRPGEASLIKEIDDLDDSIYRAEGEVSIEDEVEEMIVERDQLSQELEKLKNSMSLSPQIYPVRIRGDKIGEVDLLGREPGDIDINEILQEMIGSGHDVVKLKNISDPYWNSTHYVVRNPNQIRSVFAAFDPSKINSPNLLAGAAGTGLLLSNTFQPKKSEAEY